MWCAQLGTSALHLAAANDHADTCAVLLRAGISRDARTKTERTALHLAAHAGADRATRSLLLTTFHRISSHRIRIAHTFRQIIKRFFAFVKPFFIDKYS